MCLCLSSIKFTEKTSFLTTPREGQKIHEREKKEKRGVKVLQKEKKRSQSSLSRERERERERRLVAAAGASKEGREREEECSRVLFYRRAFLCFCEESRLLGVSKAFESRLSRERSDFFFSLALD